MAFTRSKNIVKPVAFNNKQLKNLFEQEIKTANKNIGLTCMGLSLERSLKNKDETYSPPWIHIVQGYVAHKIAPAVWTFDAPSKKKKSVSFLSTSISSTFLQN